MCLVNSTWEQKLDRGMTFGQRCEDQLKFHLSCVPLLNTAKVFYSHFWIIIKYHLYIEGQLLWISNSLCTVFMDHTCFIQTILDVVHPHRKLSSSCMLPPAHPVIWSCVSLCGQSTLLYLNSHSVMFSSISVFQILLCFLLLSKYSSLCLHNHISNPWISSSCYSLCIYVSALYSKYNNHNSSSCVKLFNIVECIFW